MPPRNHSDTTRPAIKPGPARLASVTALTGAAIAILLTVVGGALHPGYDHVRQFISELGAKGAPNADWVSFAGFLPTGILLTLFPWFTWRALPRNPLTTSGLAGIALYAVGYTASAFFPCEMGCTSQTGSLSQTLHNMFGLVGYLAAPPALFALAAAAKSWPRAGLMQLAGGIGGSIALIGLLTFTETSTFRGLSQRLLEGGTLLWIIACGFYLSTQNHLHNTINKN